ncbi:MAG: hypothetical protein FWD73_17710 [Polyangiaceae bacterium]|nr:hypothetical protein [Polyangiaceae bacterium]
MLPRSDEEWPKALLTIARQAPPLINFDNLNNGEVFGHAQLDALLTSGSVQGRELGKNDIISADVSTVFTATANNPRYGSDLVRRVLPCRLETILERPERRTDFRIPDIEGHARANRSRLLASALTVLSAYVAEGKPAVGAATLGSFERWTELVRGAILWAGGADVLATRDGIEADDEERGPLNVFLYSLHETFETSPFTGHDLLSRFAVGDRAKLLESVCPMKQPPSPRTMGRHLAGMKGRVVNGLRLISPGETRNHNILWKIETISNGEGPK